MNKVRKVSEIVWVDYADRYLYIEYDENNSIAGISYMQGIHSHPGTQEMLQKPDKKLTEFFIRCRNVIVGHDNPSQINNAIDLYWAAENILSK